MTLPLPTLLLKRSSINFQLAELNLILPQRDFDLIYPQVVIHTQQKNDKNLKVLDKKVNFVRQDKDLSSKFFLRFFESELNKGQKGPKT